MSKSDETLQHYGVRGMKWGVIRDRNRPGGADGRPDANDNNAKTKIGKHLNSLKRERQWKSVLKELDTMSTKQIGVVKKRIDLENDLKKYSKSKMATKKDKDDYLRRDKMSNEELSRKVARLRAKENLYESIMKASKEQREFGQKVVQIGGNLGLKYAVTKSITPKDIFDSVQNPKDSYNKSKEDAINKVKDPMTKEALKITLNKVGQSKS